MPSFREVAEAEATGDIALVHDQIRRTCAVASPIVMDGVCIGASTVSHLARFGWKDVLLHSLPTLPVVTVDADHHLCDNTEFKLPR